MTMTESSGVMHRFRHAIVREPAANFGQGLTTVDLGAPDFERCRQQHGAYVAALRELGLDVEVLPADPGHPDAHFVEDVAVVTPEVAVITRPGAQSRRGEVDAIARRLERHRPLRRIDSPGTLDGGDVLMVGRRCFVGRSARTNDAGIAQLASILADHGYRTTAVDVGAGLHLKSDLNLVTEDTLVATADLSGRPELADFKVIVVPEDERYAANVVRINDALLMPAGYPATRRLLAPTGLQIIELETSELRRMDGGLTCLSLRF